MSCVDNLGKFHKALLPQRKAHVSVFLMTIKSYYYGVLQIINQTFGRSTSSSKESKRPKWYS